MLAWSTVVGGTGERIHHGAHGEYREEHVGPVPSRVRIVLKPQKLPGFFGPPKNGGLRVKENRRLL
jgi:hypothetical protein